MRQPPDRLGMKACRLRKSKARQRNAVKYARTRPVLEWETCAARKGDVTGGTGEYDGQCRKSCF
jgi:hypothetical protein